VCVACETVESPGARRWPRNLLQVLAIVLLLFISGWIAGLVFPGVVPEGGADLKGIALTPSGHEAVRNAVRRQWWASLFIYVGLCVVIFHLAPFVWRRWRGRHGYTAR